jgi:hypothetical protein
MLRIFNPDAHMPSLSYYLSLFPDPKLSDALLRLVNTLISAVELGLEGMRVQAIDRACCGRITMLRVLLFLVSTTHLTDDPSMRQYKEHLAPLAGTISALASDFLRRLSVLAIYRYHQVTLLRVSEEYSHDTDRVRGLVSMWQAVYTVIKGINSHLEDLISVDVSQSVHVLFGIVVTYIT